jgi:hypothetical protein
MDPLIFLQDWYASQCDGDWEHGYGVHIGTLDNPGWTLTVDLTYTDWEDVTTPPCPLIPIEGGQVLSWVEDRKFQAAGRQDKLMEVLEAFRQFIENNPP